MDNHIPDIESDGTEMRAHFRRLNAEIKQLLLDRRSCHLMIGKLARKVGYEDMREAIEFCVRQDPNAFSPLRRED